MEPNYTDAPEVLETQEVAEETTETPENPDERDERIAQLEKEKADLESKNKQLFERTKKAAVPSKEIDGLSTKDVLYLAKADVHQDDIEDVLEWAKFKKISVADAHKHLKSTLDVRAEERKSASVSHTKGGARGTSKTSGTDLLRRAEQTGEVPDTTDGLNDLFEARQKQRFS